MSKKTIIKRIDEYWIDGPGDLGEFISYLIELRDKYGEKAFLHYDSGYSNVTSWLTVEREETDAEYEARLAIEERNRQKRIEAEQRTLEKERQEYERLRAIFETSN